MISPTLLRSLIGGLRDGWLIAGTSVGLLAVVLTGYEALSRLRNPAPVRDVDSPLHPYAGEAWWGAFVGPEGLFAKKNLWDPYRGWRSAAHQSPGITVNSAGVRLTVPPPRDSATAIQLAILGGSEVWGVSARDSFTIPSLVAAGLRRRGLDNVEVTNLGMPGYNATQEATTLLVELARGRKPHVVAVLDGYNDMALSIILGGAGRSYSEDLIQLKLDMGARGFREELLGLGRHSALIRRLTGIGKEDGPGPTAGVCPAMAAYYEGTVRIMEAMAREFGFDLVFFQQPSDALSDKRRTVWEETFKGPPRRTERFRRCAAAIDSVMGARSGRSYFPLYRIFDHDTGTVFTDHASHTTERANGVIADGMVDVLLPRLLTLAMPGSTPPVTGRR